MNSSRFFLPGICFAVIVILSVLVYRGENQRQILKNDQVELNNIKYGLFSVDEWKQLAASIVANKIEEIELSAENRTALQEKISTFLYDLIGDFENRFYEDRRRNLLGIIQSGVAAFTGTFDKLKEDVPVFTEQIIEFLDDPQSKEALRSYLVEQLDRYTFETFSQVDYTEHDRIINYYGYEDRAEAISGLIAQINNTRQTYFPYKIALLVFVAGTGLMLILLKNLSNTEFLIFSAVSISLLIPGITLPMIEIDARISDLSFNLLGEQVSFHNQVLFYQSKSILEVVRIMFEHGGLDLIFVGFLILAFSVLFPAAKLIATMLYIYAERFRNQSFVRTLVFRTGKWSMADVMVIAIFMAFIGFDGIVSSQLNQIENLSANIQVLTTNNSGILSGFFFFTGFVLLGLIISQKLHKSK